MTLESILAWVCAVDGVSLSYRERDTALGTEGYLVLLYSPPRPGLQAGFSTKGQKGVVRDPFGCVAVHCFLVGVGPTCVVRGGLISW